LKNIFENIQGTSMLLIMRANEDRAQNLAKQFSKRVNAEDI